MPDMTEAWQRVAQEIGARKKDLGWTWKAVYARTGVSEATLLPMRRDGQGMERDDKIVSLVRGLGWSDDSVARILAGKRPVIVRNPNEDEQPDLLDAVEQLRVAVDDLRHRVGELERRLED